MEPSSKIAHTTLLARFIDISSVFPAEFSIAQPVNTGRTCLIRQALCLDSVGLFCPDFNVLGILRYHGLLNAGLW